MLLRASAVVATVLGCLQPVPAGAFLQGHYSMLAAHRMSGMLFALAPGRYDADWKDTVDVRPSEAVEVAVKFTDYAGRYMLHCHNLEHEDMAMMADFSTQ